MQSKGVSQWGTLLDFNPHSPQITLISAACSWWLFTTCIVLTLEPTQQTLSGKKLGSVLSWLTLTWRPLAWLRDPPNDRVTQPPSVEDKLIIRSQCLSAGNANGNEKKLHHDRFFLSFIQFTPICTMGGSYNQTILFRIKRTPGKYWWNSYESTQRVLLVVILLVRWLSRKGKTYNPICTSCK